MYGDSTSKVDKKKRLLIVGAGGIGSQLADILIPALTAGRLSENVGGVEVTLMDDDRVEIGNLSHQRHQPRMVGREKVASITERLTDYTSPSLSLVPRGERLKNSKQLNGYDLVVVAVDSSDARKIVHENCDRWLDLRCGGDGMVALDHNSDDSLVLKMTPLGQPPASCQIPGSIDAGNVQMGYALAAAHGAQWAIQNLREISNLPFRPTPSRILSLTFGELEFPTVVLAVGGE